MLHLHAKQETAGKEHNGKITRGGEEVGKTGYGRFATMHSNIYLRGLYSHKLNLISDCFRHMRAHINLMHF